MSSIIHNLFHVIHVAYKIILRHPQASNKSSTKFWTCQFRAEKKKKNKGSLFLTLFHPPFPFPGRHTFRQLEPILHKELLSPFFPFLIPSPLTLGPPFWSRPPYWRDRYAITRTFLYHIPYSLSFEKLLPAYRIPGPTCRRRIKFVIY